jgi:hypothetical protein
LDLKLKEREALKRQEELRKKHAEDLKTAKKSVPPVFAIMAKVGFAKPVDTKALNTCNIEMFDKPFLTPKVEGEGVKAWKANWNAQKVVCIFTEACCCHSARHSFLTFLIVLL